MCIYIMLHSLYTITLKLYLEFSRLHTGNLGLFVFLSLWLCLCFSNWKNRIFIRQNYTACRKKSINQSICSNKNFKIFFCVAKWKTGFRDEKKMAIKVRLILYFVITSKIMKINYSNVKVIKQRRSLHEQNIFFVICGYPLPVRPASWRD